LVPNSWDEDEGEEAWFDAAVDQDTAALADAVALAPLQSRPTLPVAAVLSSSHGQLTDVISSVEDLFDRPAAAILPTPAARTPALRPAPAKERRSARLRAKPAMPAMDKAIRVLNFVCTLIATTTSLALPDKAIQALVALFRLNLPVPSITAADEALIAMAGQGGTDLDRAATPESVA
jgi:hypothetical protein